MSIKIGFWRPLQMTISIYILTCKLTMLWEKFTSLEWEWKNCQIVKAGKILSKSPKETFLQKRVFWNIVEFYVI